MLLVIPALTSALYAQDKAKAYTDKTYGFSVNFASDFKVATGARARSQTAFGDPGTGTKIVKVSPVSIPSKYHGDYEFNVWRSNNSRAKCGAPTADERDGNIPIEGPAEGSPKTMSIDGHIFYAFTGSEGGMSKSLGLIGYRGKVGNRCWQIQAMTYQVSAFDDYKAFDDKIIQKSFETFVASFKFAKKK
jgi:hypothetical protein